MPFAASTDELLALLNRNEHQIRVNPILREAVRILAVSFEQALYEQDADYLKPEATVLTIVVTPNMRAAYQVILEEVAAA